MTPTTAETPVSLQKEEVANMVFAAAQEMFVSMMGAEVQLLPEPDAGRSDVFDGVLSLIGLAGAVAGSGALICSSEVACDLSSRLLMSECPQVDAQTLDSVGEITNMIVGGLKNLIEPYTGELRMSVPTVIHGKNIFLRNSQADMAVAVRCGYPQGEFELTVRLSAARK